MGGSEGPPTFHNQAMQHLVFAQVSPVTLPDIPSTLVAGGTAGLILALAIAFVLFLRGDLRRGKEAEDWKAIATTMTAAVDKLVPAVEKLTEAVSQQASVPATVVKVMEAVTRLAEATERQNDEARSRDVARQAVMEAQASQQRRRTPARPTRQVER